MAHRKIELEIERLGLLRQAPPKEATAALRKALADRVNLMVAKAAKIIAELEITELEPELLRTFERLFEDPVESDPQCWGKNAIANALRDLGHQIGSSPNSKSQNWSRNCCAPSNGCSKIRWRAIRSAGARMPLPTR